MSQPVELFDVHVVLGDEDLLVRQAVEGIIHAAFEGKGPGFNLAQFEAGGGANAALDLARTQPMMARRRVVVVREMEKAPVELLDALMSYVEKPNPSTVLILTGQKTPEAAGGKDRGRRLVNLVQKTGKVGRFRAKDQRPVPFAQQLAQEAGCPIDRRAAELLVELVGADLGRLKSELDKAIAYVGGAAPIEISTIEAVTCVVGEAVIWDLTDAILARDTDRALAATHRMLEESGPGERASYRLLGMVAWQMRQLLLLQDSLRLGAAAPPSWSRMPAFKLQAAQRRLRSRPLSATGTMGALARASRDFNRSRAGDQRVFEGLVLSLVAG